MKKIGKRMMAAMLTFVLFFAMVPETVCVKNVWPSAKQILSDYEKSSQYQKHPRIMITKQIVDDQLKPIASNVNDPRNALYNKIMTRAEKLCVWIVDQNSQDQLPKYSYKYESRMPVNGNPENPSGGNTSDDFKYKIMVLGLAYQMTDVAAQKKRYAEQKERLQNAIVRLCFQVANESYAKKSVFKEVKHNLQKSRLGTGNMKGVEYVHNHKFRRYHGSAGFDR